MIIFGGENIEVFYPNQWVAYADYSGYGDGARYNPLHDRWTTLSAEGAPTRRAWHTALWTGSSMIVWGGVQHDPSSPSVDLNSGAIYDPTRDAWSAMAAGHAPEGRRNHIAAWTGEEMIVWGGETESNLLNDGARYNPKNRHWRAITEDDAPQNVQHQRPEAGIWTGNAMFFHAAIYDFGTSQYLPAGFTWLYHPDRGRPKP